MRLLFLIAPLSPCLGFAPSSVQTPTIPGTTISRTYTAATPLFLSGQDDSEPRRQSRFEGMQREPTAADLTVIDDMITKLSEAKPYELPNAVSRAIRVVSSPQFFLRIAERADEASDPIEKEKLSALAENLVNTIQAVVSMTEESLDERARDVERVVKAASEPESGEFLVPLSKERVDAMRMVMEGLDEADLNEGFLSTVDAWMNKAHQDGMDGMVTIMQKALQIYAGTAISRARIQLQANVGAALVGEDQAAADAAAAAEKESSESAASALLGKLFFVDTDEWDAEIRKGIAEADDVSKDALIGEVQKTMEGVILGLENGSMVQRVQAEYLRELVTRIEAV
mmetsp:Transcript_16024/g.38489  ORF Transcript_16024/g.38489 Transcript_16024/m.38489 type:complete len:342 (+) Transcript_16024:123-1148(+)|eukprot:CAMPEP_0181102040 /NCGR_PEP_ID=MMETSP1071-20121207/14092_1 /TAXON_ID=35127 /ORGANISM="Thalassiosira sp., Strain NH16" /LENGTH=341 /DNA_ID=CAMNT_0023184965 /DNA_START=110 /DNA_END=1135 /DNA_ORIENTATION=+